MESMERLNGRVKIIPRRLIKDDRGWFLKVIDGKEEHLPPNTGEIYLTMGRSGQSKGGHYHPKAVEWFTLIKGAALFKLFDVLRGKYDEINLNFENAVTIFVPNNIAHEFVNTGADDFILLAYTDLLYDPSDTIAFKFDNYDRCF